MKLSKRESILLTILIGLVVIGAYTFYLFLPKYNGYIMNRDRLQHNKKQLEELQELEISEKLKKEAQEIKEKWVKLDETIPSSMNLPLLYMNLLSMRDSSKVRYQTLEFNIPEKSTDTIYEDGTHLGQVDIAIVLEGTYENIDHYLELLYRNNRMLEISKIRFKTVENKLEVTLDVHAFALVKAGTNQSSDYEFINGKSYGKSNPFK